MSNDMVFKRLEEAIQDAWGDIVEPETSERLYSHQATITNIRDRTDGRHLPVYETEWDVRTIAMMGRLLHERVPMGKAKTNRLRDYTIGVGFDWNITHERPEVAHQLTKLIERFLRDSQWYEEWERESFVQECVDGNWLAELTVEQGQLVLVPLYLDNLVEPMNARQLEEYYRIDYPASWSFGVLSPEYRAHDVRGYHIVRDEGGMDWDFIPKDRMIHWKRNVPPTAKLGVSDHYTPHLYLGRADRVLSRTAEGVAIQAAIAYIVEHGPDTTGNQVQRILSRLVNRDGFNPTTGRAESTSVSRSGSRVDVYGGAKYHAGPIGSTGRNAVYIEVMEAILRLSGTPDAVPEYMMTGSAENNNFASIKESASPFIQGRKADTEKRGRRLEALLRKACKLAANSRLLRSIGIESFEEIEDSLDITVNPPEVYTRDPGLVTTEVIAQLGAGLISKRTATKKLGHDYDDEQKQLADDAAGNPGGDDAMGKPPAMGSISRQQWKRNGAAIKDIIAEFEDETISLERATAMMGLLGIDAATAKQLLGTAGNAPPNPLATATEDILRQAWGDYCANLQEGFDPNQARGKDGRWIDNNEIESAAKSKDQQTRIAFLRDVEDKDKLKVAKQMAAAKGAKDGKMDEITKFDLRLARNQSKKMDAAGTSPKKPEPTPEPPKPVDGYNVQVTNAEMNRRAAAAKAKAAAKPAPQPPKLPDGDGYVAPQPAPPPQSAAATHVDKLTKDSVDKFRAEYQDQAWDQGNESFLTDQMTSKRSKLPKGSQGNWEVPSDADPHAEDYRKLTSYSMAQGQYLKAVPNGDPQNMEFAVLPLDEVKPSQFGDDYENDSSRGLAPDIGTWMKSGRAEDYAPIVLRADGTIADGNHRHAARKLAGINTIPVLRPKAEFRTKEQVQEDFDESDHPRGKDGRFIGKGKMDAAAKATDADGEKKAAELYRRVAPKDAGKLDAEFKQRGMSQAKIDAARKLAADGADTTLNTGAPAKARKAAKPRAAAPKQKTPSERTKSAIAKSSAVRTDAKVQDRATENEKWLAEEWKDIGGRWHGDSAPADVETDDGLIELKTMVVGKNGKLTMNLYAQVLKVNKEKAEGKPFHTIVFDETDGERKLFYRRGIAGSARIEALHPVSDLEELKTLMKLDESELPSAAKRTDLGLFTGEWVPQAEGERALVNTLTGKVAKPKK